MLWQSMVLQCKSRMGGAFGASGTRVPPIVNPAQSVRREWGGGGARGSPKVKVEGLVYWGEIWKCLGEDTIPSLTSSSS